MDFSSSALMMPSLDSHIPGSQLPILKPFSPDEEARLSGHTPDLSQTLTSVDEVGELVDGLLTNASAASGLEWFDCLMCDTDDPIASCFEPNPCESTHSSEPAASSDLLPCTPLDEALPDAFALMGGANLFSPGWTHEGIQFCQDMAGTCPPSRNTTGMCAISRDMAGMCATGSQEMVSTSAPSRDVVSGMREKCDGAGDGGRWSDRGRVQQRSNLVPAHGVRLMQLLLEGAKAVENDHPKAAMVISQVKVLASRHGDPIQRLAAYFAEALSCRLARAQGTAELACPRVDGSAQELTLAYLAMNEACPYFIFAQLTANQAILEAIEGADKVHIVDFGISQGVQWAAMLQAIAAREGRIPPSRITITGVASPELGGKRRADSLDSLAATGRRLSDFAHNLNLNLEFRHTLVALDDSALAPHMFHIEAGEVVVVNFMLELCNLLDGADNVAVARTLRVAAELSPKVITIAEMDARLNTGPFQKRFVSALHFFSAMFDSLEAGMSRDSVHRLCMERWLLGERILTMVGGQDEGPRRRIQTHADWCAAFQAANFQPCSLSHYAASQARILLWNYCDSFTLNEQQGCLSLGWQSKPLLTVSAWTVIA